MSASINIPLGSALNPLQILQFEYALLEISGKFGVIQKSDLIWYPSMSTAPALKVFSGSEIKTLLMRRLQKVASSMDPGVVIKDFLHSPNTTIYRNLAFSPVPVASDILNLWHGMTIQPQQGSWLTIQQYLEHVLCSSDKDAYQYLRCYLAHMLQKPEEKPGVMIVLLGGQGIGKGTLEVILRKMFAATTLMVSDVDSVVGRFNSCLERAYIVFMDEALFNGDKKSTDRLKNFVTAKHIQIEAKHQPERSIESFHRFFAASNSQHFANTEYDDRRMFYLKVSEQFKGNHQYWKALYKAIQAGEVEAMVHDLLAQDLTDFVPGNRPVSKELLHQKIQSLPSFERFWFGALWDGETYELGVFSSSCRHSEWKAGYPWKSKDILEVYEHKSRAERYHKKLNGRDVAEALRKICPSATLRRRMENGDRANGYDLPDLTTARTEFEVYLEDALSWPDV
jgi:hypothetical protein